MPPFWRRPIAFVQREPAVLMSLAGSGVGLATSLGLQLNAGQTKAVYGFVAAVTGVLIRQAVVPSSTVSVRLTAVEQALAEIQAATNRPSFPDRAA